MTRALVGVSAPQARQASHADRLSAAVIRRYPEELESTETIPSLGKVTIRPIKSEDAPLLGELVRDLAPEDARMRFFIPVRSLDSEALANFTQIDYDRQMAFVMFRSDSSSPILAVAQLAADPSNLRAEFAILVRSELHRRGIGRLMMKRLIQYARDHGLSELVGDVLAENHAMLDLCTGFGFRFSNEGAGVTRATLKLKSRISPVYLA